MLNLQCTSIVEEFGARSGLWLGSGMGFGLWLKHAGWLHTVYHHRQIFLLHVGQRQQWLKQSPDLALWRRDGWQHAEVIQRQQAEYCWFQVRQWVLSTTQMWRHGPEYSFHLDSKSLKSKCGDMGQNINFL